MRLLRAKVDINIFMKGFLGLSLLFLIFRGMFWSCSDIGLISFLDLVLGTSKHRPCKWSAFLTTAVSDMRGLEMGWNAVVCSWAMASTVFTHCIYLIYCVYRMPQLIVSWPRVKMPALLSSSRKINCSQSWQRCLLKCLMLAFLIASQMPFFS